MSSLIMSVTCCRFSAVSTVACRSSDNFCVRSIVWPSTCTVSAWICVLVGVRVLRLTERQLLAVSAALRGEQVRQGGAVEWSAEGSGDALHHRDAGYANEGLGHPVQRDEVRRVAHVVIRLDHQ